MPNMTGNMNSIIRWVLCWAGSDEGTWLIFCCTYMLRPERATRTKPRMLPARIGSSARSKPTKPRSTGTALSRNGSQLYSLSESPARFSGVKGRTPLIAQKRPMKIGI